MYSQNEKVDPVNVAEETSKSFLDYSMSVIISYKRRKTKVIKGFKE